MKLSIWSNYYHELSVEEAVEALLRNGITAAELADEHAIQLLNRDPDVVKTGKQFATFIKARNFEISQGHLWIQVKICTDDTAIKKLYRWIDLYEAIGIKNMVLHCDPLFDSGLNNIERAQKNIKKLKLLATYIQNKDVTICLENLGPIRRDETQVIDHSAEDLLYIINGIGSDKFGICLDTGHLNLTHKNQREFIQKAGSKLKALHIADNHGYNDEHLMPGGGDIDFKEVVDALRAINYSGLFNLEIPGESYVSLAQRSEKIRSIIDDYHALINSLE